jgi:hypothetical protein
MGQVTLHYNTFAFALRNDSKDPIDLNAVSIAREDNSAMFGRADMPTRTLNEGECLFIVSNSSQSVEINPQWKCEESSPPAHQRPSDFLFWRVPADSESQAFNVMLDGEIIATCDVIGTDREDNCKLQLPLVGGE